MCALPQVEIVSLIRRTRSHPKYAQTYNLPSFKLGWYRYPRQAVQAVAEGGEGQGDSKLKLLALDCEMCETDRDSSALLGLCVVDEDCNVVLKVRLTGAKVRLTGV